MGTLYPLLLGKQDGDKKDKTAADDKVKYRCTIVKNLASVARSVEGATEGISRGCNFPLNMSLPVGWNGCSA